MTTKVVNWKRQHLIFIFLACLIYVAVGFLALRFNQRFDLVSDSNNSLTKASQQIISELNSPLEITAFVRGNKEVKRLIQQRIAEYQHYSDNITLNFKNPDTELALVKQFNIQTDGELYLQYQGHSENVKDLSEASISQAILKLLGEKSKHVLYISGQGEADLDPNSSHFKSLNSLLLTNNIIVSQQNLSKQPRIADNIEMLVLINAQTHFSAPSQQAINDFIDRGGNLLILADSGQDYYHFIGDKVGVHFSKSQLLNDSALAYQIKEKQYIAFDQASRYPPLQALPSLLLFPKVMTLDTETAVGWQLIPFLTADKSQNSLLLNNQTISEVATSVTYGIEATRLLNNQRQRLVFIADSDFLSDRFIGTGSNQNFTLALVQHILSADYQLDFSKRKIEPIYLSDTNKENLTGVLLLFLPLGFLLIGLFIQRRLR